MHAFVARLAVLLVVVSGCKQSPDNAVSNTSGADTRPVAAADAEWTASVEAWRAKHEADYRRDWATIAGLHFLEPGAYRLGSEKGNDIVLPASVPPAVGRLQVGDGWVKFESASGVVVTRENNPLGGTIVLKEPGKDAADEISVNDVRFAVHESGKRLSLRVWDPNGKQAREFAGFSWFPINASYRVVARFVPDAKPTNIPVVNTYGDEDLYPTEGVVEFSVGGETVRLRPFTTRPKRFYFVFRDASSGHETYETARFLYSDLRDDGTTVLDFNEAYNPPCAFNPYTTCPIPLKENRLSVKILAGEKAYSVDH